MNNLNEYKNRFYTLMESTIGDVKPLISEQKLTDELINSGFKNVNEIDLPNGSYVGNPSKQYFYDLAKSINAYNVHYVMVFSNDGKFTGYVLFISNASRSGYDDVEVNVTNKKADFGDSYWFKESGYEPTTAESTTQEVQTITNNVASEGIKNVSQEMISSPQFKGTYSSSTFGGVFNGIDYRWNCNGVDGVGGIRGIANVEIISSVVEDMLKSIKKEAPDAKPGSPCVGVYGNQSLIRFIIYTTKSGGVKSIYF